jgi:uncharacterized membrane protein YebE (DUF533 family)
MTSRLTRSLIAAVTLAASAGALSMTASADGIDRRQTNQERRITDGVRSGTLTRTEAQRLEAEQGRIREMERRARADGHVDRYERFRINQAQNAASRHIFRETHDSENRGRRYWGYGYGYGHGHGHGHGHGYGPRPWYRWW